MYPRLYMQSIQSATYDYGNEEVTFESRLASGARFKFQLSKNQFLALNDAILLIDRGPSYAYGHYPLGQRIWFHYNFSDASLYRDERTNRIYFNFACFHEYKAYTHRRLLSLVRLNEDGDGRVRVRRRGGGEDENKSTSRKRAFPDEVQATNKPSTSKSCRWKERETTSRSSDDAELSPSKKESAIFPEWHYSNPRRGSDSISSLSSDAENFEHDEHVPVYAPSDSSYTMEY